MIMLILISILKSSRAHLIGSGRGVVNTRSPLSPSSRSPHPITVCRYRVQHCVAAARRKLGFHFAPIPHETVDARRSNLVAIANIKDANPANLRQPGVGNVLVKLNSEVVECARKVAQSGVSYASAVACVEGVYFGKVRQSVVSNLSKLNFEAMDICEILQPGVADVGTLRDIEGVDKAEVFQPSVSDALAVTQVEGADGAAQTFRENNRYNGVVAPTK